LVLGRRVLKEKINKKKTRRSKKKGEDKIGGTGHEGRGKKGEVGWRLHQNIHIDRNGDLTILHSPERPRECPPKKKAWLEEVVNGRVGARVS